MIIRPGSRNIPYTRPASSPAGNCLALESGLHRPEPSDLSKAVLVARFRCTLDDEAHEQHATKLYVRFKRRWDWLSEKQVEDRLRFVTVLYELVGLDTAAIDQSIERMRSGLLRVVTLVRGLPVVAAAEIEIVNLRVLREKADREDEKEAISCH